MSQQLINIGNTANDGTGVRLRDAFRIVNENFTEVYTSLSGNITAFNATFSGNVRLNTLGRTGGNLYYLPLADGGAGQVLATDGAGLLSWTNNGSGASPTQLTNGTSNVILALNGNLAVSVGGTSNVMVVSATSANITGTANISSNITAGNINSVSGILSVTGNANVGNLGTAGLITVTGNITGGNLSTAGILSVTGNASAGNISTSGLITATGNITGGNLHSGTGNVTGGNLTMTGNVTGGNLVTAGALSVTGNANVGNLGATASVVTRSLHTGVLVSSLPLAAAANAGAIQYVTDASATTIGTTVAGGGSNKVMVWSDGSNWKIFAS